MKVREIMTREPSVMTPEEPVSRAGQIMREWNVGLVPVVADRENMRLLGVITDRDIALRHVAANHWIDCAVEAHMTDGELWVADEGQEVKQVLDLMMEHHVRRVPVVEGNRKVVGIVSLTDVIRRMGADAPGNLREILEEVYEAPTGNGEREPTRSLSE